MGCNCLEGVKGLVSAVLNLDPADEGTKKARRDVCRGCEHARLSGGKLTTFSTCGLCGCNLRGKTSLKGEKCPDGRWT